jgi:hypothetical protein
LVEDLINATKAVKIALSIRLSSIFRQTTHWSAAGVPPVQTQNYLLI